MQWAAEQHYLVLVVLHSTESVVKMTAHKGQHFPSVQMFDIANKYTQQELS
jgi:hypothetical protein